MQEDNHHKHYAFWIKLASTASVVTASLLVIVKTWGWLQTHSVSVLASLIDSSADLIVSLLSFLAIRYALKPADDDHPFGHGKAEALAALAQALMITGSAVYLLLSALQQMYQPRPLETLELGIWAMGFSLFMTLLLLSIQRVVIAKTGSLAIQADSLHYATDLLSNGAVLLTIVLLMYGWTSIDPWVALFVAAYVLFSAWKIAMASFDQLMDKQLSVEIEADMLAAAQAVEGVVRAHHLRSRQSGATFVVQLYIDLEPNTPLHESHRLGDAVRDAIRVLYPNTDVLVHEEPAAIQTSLS
jgi:ferrous-iron efflux pump FieF